MLKGVLVGLHSMHLRYYEKVVSQTSKQLQRRGYKIEDISGWTHSSILSLDWFKGKYAGKPHMSWEKQWFPVDFPLNQSNGLAFVMVGVSDTKNHPLFLPNVGPSTATRLHWACVRSLHTACAMRSKRRFWYLGTTKWRWNSVQQLEPAAIQSRTTLW